MTGIGSEIGGLGRGRVIRTAALTVGAVALATIVAGALVVSLAVGATAGDNVAIFTPEPDEIDAEPGEEFEVDVVVRSHGGYGDTGVSSVIFRALYHPDYLAVTDVERGPWMEQGDDTDIESTTTLAHERGVAEVEQSRDPPEGGATGRDVLVTLTVRVSEDAPPSEATIDFGESEVVLTDRYPQAVHDRDLTVSIDGGGEHHGAFDHGDLDDLEASEPSSTGGGESGDVDEEGGGDAKDDGGNADDDSIAGFTAVTAALAVLALVLVGANRRR